MSDISAENGPHDYLTSHVIPELASNADKAFVVGDYTRCVAIVQNIYDLLDRHAQSVAAK